MPSCYFCATYLYLMVPLQPMCFPSCSRVRTASCAGSQADWRKSCDLTTLPSQLYIGLSTRSVRSGLSALPWTSGKRWVYNAVVFTFWKWGSVIFVIFSSQVLKTLDKLRLCLCSWHVPAGDLNLSCLQFIGNNVYWIPMLPSLITRSYLDAKRLSWHYT